MNYDARVSVRPRTTTRVELIRGYTGRNGHNRHFERLAAVLGQFSLP